MISLESVRGYFISPPNVYMSNTGFVPGITGGYNAYTGASVMPAGMKLRFSHELLHIFSTDQKMRQN